MSSSLLDQYQYTISDIRFSDLPMTYSTSGKPIYLVEITKITDKDTRLLKSAVGLLCKNQIVWSEQILDDITPESTINFKVLRKRKKGGSETIGEYTDTVFGFLDKQKLTGMCKVDMGNESRLSFTIQEDCFKDVLNRAKQQNENVHFEGVESWSELISYFRIVKKAVDPIAELSPYAQQAWNIISAVSKILEKQLNRNSSLNQLLQRLTDIYGYISDADRLPTLTTNQTKNLKLLIQQTCECAYYIKEYAEKNTVMKLWKGSSVDDKIPKFKEAFDRLFDAIQKSIILETSIVTLRVSKSVNKIRDSHLLGEIAYAQNAGFVDAKKCLPGTRQKLINEILEWVDKDTSNHVLLLSGQAGMGKSAVAHTIAEIFRAQNRLGSLFCFSRNDKDRRNYLFGTISRDLADSDVSWRQTLVNAIGPTAIRRSLDPVTQFDEMIIKPSRDIKTIGPVVIIIDALDECGDRTERQALLNLLFERSSELPKTYRIIMTSRPEPDIEERYWHPNVLCKHMADTDPNDTLHDIRRFFSHKLSPAARTLDAKLGWDWSLQLAEKAQGLFQWANVACLYIDPTVKIGLVKRAKTVISKPSSSLYELYHQVLDGLPEFQVEGFFTIFQRIIGAIVFSRKSLSVLTLQELLGPDIEDTTVHDVLHPFQSLLIGVHDSTIQIRPLHASLFDFFMSAEQNSGTPNRYYIDKSDQSSLTRACFRVMNAMLRFNICGLETSHLRNRDISNFNSRVAEAIPPHLSYACCFWGYHLEYSSLNPELLEEICDLMHNKLLYFFEALGLLGEVEHGRVAMQILKNKTKNENSELAARAAEASQFAFEFGKMMVESTPHLYLSSLPYISNHSFISRQFMPQYPQLLSIDVGQPLDLRPEIEDSVAQRHPFMRPSVVAFSPCGRRIANGYANGDLWVWDHITGEMIRQLGAEGKVIAVCDVVFSPNGELVYCCYKDGSILTWEANTNKVIYEFNKEVTKRKCRNCVISPDGRYTAFQLKTRSYSQRVCFYERETDSKLFEGSSGPDSKMMFSRCGRLFGFQNEDGVLRLWDTRTQTFISLCWSIAEPWTLEALADNYIIIRMAWHSTSGRVREVWDIRTGTKVRRFEPESKYDCDGHFTFSTNGECVLRSEGNKHWIWNISTGEIKQRSVGRDSDNAFLTAISHDLKYMAFAMSNSTTTHVVTWDVLGQGDIEGCNSIHESLELRQAWLESHHLLLDTGYQSIPATERRYLEVLDKKSTGLNIDYKAEIEPLSLVEVFPKDKHWSIAYVTEPGTLRLWDIDKKEDILLDKSVSKVTALAFSVTGDCLVSGSWEGNIRVWDLRTRQLISHGGVSSPVTALGFSPMGIAFFVAYGTGRETFIEERECESQSIVNGPLKYGSAVHSIFVASRHVCVIFWDRFELLDRSTCANIKCFNYHLLPKFSPDRRYIAWVPKEARKEVELWDLEEGIPLAYGFPFGGKITSFEFSSDPGRISILGNADENMKRVDIWDIEDKKLVTRCLFNRHRLEPRSLRHYMALCEDNLLLIDAHNMGKIWSLHVHEFMSPLYNGYLNDSQFVMLPRHPDFGTSRSSSANTEALEYARVAWNKATFSPSTKLGKDGWMLDPHGKLLFWVPEKMRDGLWYPCTTHMIFRVFTKLKFDKFVHGTRWTECRTQLL